MKIRQGFVSNSSSSSFIVIGKVTNGIAINRLREIYGNRESLAIGPDFGNHQFGWEEEKYTSFEDRLMFSWIQAKTVERDNPKWLRMLNEVLKDKLKVKDIYWNVSIDFTQDTDNWCYIDHQSSSTEDANIEMFESEENLVNFLFAHDSYIQGDNDNHE